MKSTQLLCLAAALGLGTPGLVMTTGCEESALEEAGDNVDDAVDDTADAVDDAADDTDDALREATEDLDG